MSLKQELDTLLNKEMDRKTFMKHIAFAVAMLSGVSVLIKILTSLNHGSLDIAQLTPQQPSRRGGYGRVGYGSKIESETTV